MGHNFEAIVCAFMKLHLIENIFMRPRGGAGRGRVGRGEKGGDTRLVVVVVVGAEDGNEEVQEGKEEEQEE